MVVISSKRNFHESLALQIIIKLHNLIFLLCKKNFAKEGGMPDLAKG